MLSSNSLADHPATTSLSKHHNKNVTNDELQKIINDFDAYVAGIPANVREEIKEYRIKIAHINKEKRELYTRISQEGQNYLAEEQKYKKRMLALKKDAAHSQDTISAPKNNEAINKARNLNLPIK